jgi:hypothetical protein
VRCAAFGASLLNVVHYNFGMDVDPMRRGGLHRTRPRYLNAAPPQLGLLAFGQRNTATQPTGDGLRRKNSHMRRVISTPSAPVGHRCPAL